MPTSAATSAISVLRGRWKFVTSASTCFHAYPGVMKIPVRPVLAENGSPAGWLSSTRADVVPTAMTRRPSALAAFSDPAAREPWAYRIPSLVGATAAVLLTGWIGGTLFGASVGTATGLLLAASLLLGAEARMAKIDAALLAAVLVAQASLLRIHLDAAAGIVTRRRWAAAHWAALGAGLMLKGPLILLVSWGTIAGLLFPQDLAVPTAGAVLIGVLSGYLAGKPVSTMAALDGMLAGIMGGMMGAMLGVMLGKNAAMMELFVDVLFLFIHLVLQQLIKEESARPDAAENKGGAGAGSVLLHPYAFGLGIFVLAAVFLYQG